MAYEFTAEYDVPFADTDMAGIMHFSRFVVYMERTEHAFLRSLGLSVHQAIGDRVYGWPRVSVSCDFKRALRFEDRFAVRLLVAERAEKTLRYTFVFTKGDERVAVGRMTAICVAMPRDGEEPMRATAIPQLFNDKIEPAPADALAAARLETSP